MSMFKRKDPSALQAQLASLKGGSGFSSDDKNEWKLTVDSAGNGSARIRFLPGKGEDGLPFVKLVNHGFKKNGKWYIENCTSTHNDYDSCPVCQHLSKNDSFNTNPEEYKQLKRKTSFWANILVVKDPSNPANDGKIFKYRFGQKIMEKINAMVEVDTDMGETPVDVTCVFEGADFALKVKKHGGFQNYDDSKFLGQSEIKNIDDEAVQKQISEGMHDIMSVASKDKFNSFEKNDTKFKQIMGTAALGGGAAAASSQADALANELDQFDKDLADFGSTPSSSASSKVDESAGSTGDDDLDALLSEF